MRARAKKCKHSKAWKCAASMPPLHHTLPDQAFDSAKSQVLGWMIRQPQILNAMFDWYRYNGAIVFQDGRWHGVENNQKL
jgi:hypothetical protein